MVAGQVPQVIQNLMLTELHHVQVENRVSAVKRYLKPNYLPLNDILLLYTSGYPADLNIPFRHGLADSCILLLYISAPHNHITCLLEV